MADSLSPLYKYYQLYIQSPLTILRISDHSQRALSTTLVQMFVRKLHMALCAQ